MRDMTTPGKKSRRCFMTISFCMRPRTRVGRPRKVGACHQKKRKPRGQMPVDRLSGSSFGDAAEPIEIMKKAFAAVT